ncbi:hypothetical protein FCM35_KLT10734 [Carex littledalei]|uniref:CXXC motif containing zinc binding protein n=1 Tax=Carex littledalei TaxID=544730 RepID=A0A833QLM1_9POAL|nr:hypothetical protein FCM35_KLT10734 [Carex littledalei]
MVYYALEFTAELDGLTNLQPRGGCDDPNFTYYFKLKCENCGEISQKPTWLSLSEEVPLPNGRGTANLVQKCKLCKRDGTIQMIPGQGKPLTDIQGQSDLYTRLMIFDCRGFEPVEFSFTDGWMAESKNGETTFEMDLSEGEFCDYDEKSECPVGVSNLKSVFKVVKKSGDGARAVYR